MLISIPFKTKFSAFLLILFGLYVSMADAATPDVGGLPVLQALALVDEAGWSAMIAGVMVMFGLLFGRALIEGGGRLHRSDRALWLLVWLAGLGAGGVVLSNEREQAGMLLWCALVLAFLMAITAWRCRTVGVAGGPVFAMAALSAITGPAWVAWHGMDASAAGLGWVVLASGIALALIMLSVPLLWAISSQSATASSAEVGTLPGMTGEEEPEPEPARGVSPEQRRAKPEPSEAGRAGRVVGLATPAMLLERLGHGMRRSERANVPLALLWVDVRGAPDVVRLFGEDAVEELLAEVSRRLDEALRLESSLSRTGDHCFAAVCEAVTDLDEVLAIMTRLREKLALPCELSDGAIRIDASFGHALFPQDGADVKTLCRIAARRARGAVRRESRPQPTRLLEEHGLTS